MKFRHLEYFVAAAEELNFTHAADRLHVSQPPFSKQIHDLEGELRMELFERRRKGVALTAAGKTFLVDARRILEDCNASISKAQRISRGEVGELAIGYISALTHDFMGKALEVAAGFGVAVISEPLQKIPAKNVIFRDLAPEDRAWVPVAAAWKPDALTAPVASQFIDVLAQACADGNAGSRALRTVV
jgi:DNA-binding transcriptional LysR family regulator